MNVNHRTGLTLLSFDTEEFDIPIEYGQKISRSLQMEIAATGTESVMVLLESLDIRATFFITVAFAREYPDLVCRLARRHEIASHGWEHSRFDVSDLLRSRCALEEIASVRVTGFRRSRFERTDLEALQKAGYLYDSSVNPIWLPGRYNYFNQPRTVTQTGGVLQIPISATPRLRVPLFWLSFKNFPLWFTHANSWITLKSDGYLNLFFHPWEFCDLKPFHLPWYVKRPDGRTLLLKLDRHLQWLQKFTSFATLAEFSMIFRNDPSNFP